MGAGDAKRLIVGALFAAGLIQTVNSVSHGEPPPVRPIFGLTVAGGVLLVGADALPAVCAALAVAIAVSTLYTSGAQAFDTIGKAVS